ncbi:MAG TPA: ATP-binding protein [Tepidisphaeraceae bacterium]|nr:ATP-binding protein [Tepidisphaeraceae bacterium]
MRGKVLIFLIVAFIVGGLTCSVLALAHAKAAVMAAAIPGAVLLLLAATAGLMNALAGRRHLLELVEQIHERSSGAAHARRLDTNSPDLLPIADAVNQLMEAAERTVSDAAIKVKELEIQLKVATAERQHAEAIIYSISDAVLVTDPFDDLVLANESAARTFDFDLARANRAPVEQVLRDDKVIAMIREMRQSNSTSGRRIVEHTVKTSGGDKTFKVTLSCVADKADENPAGVVAVLHDISKEKEVSEMKNDFVSNVSHELRTPLASIKAYIEMLIDGEADDEKTKTEFYEVIQNESNRLSRLIDNILNISRIESGLVKINKQPQSLTVIMKEALEVIAPQAKGKQITLCEQLTPVFYQTVADRDMLYQAVLNLLSNAVKYTPEGGAITVQTEVNEAKKKVMARISDTGVGIPPKDLPFVFDKFYRVEANNRMAKGTGLGLSLVKHIVETVHHGRIFVESTQGKGSTFGFELDLAE